MEVTIRNVSGTLDNHTMGPKIFKEFKLWLIDDNSSNIFILEKESYTFYILKSQIECVDTYNR